MLSQFVKRMPITTVLIPMHNKLSSLFLLLLLVTRSFAGPTAVPDSPADLPKGPPPLPAPFLSAEDAISTMRLPPGFKMEVVAAEPLIEHPIAMAFDPQGRAWVVEMRSYMPDVQGNGENSPTGRISILEDTDHDGRMDKCTVFMDHLVLPRAIGLARGGALVAVPPKLLFCRDINNDGKADEQTVIATDYGITGNPEHQPNGLVPAMDNWIYSANYDKRIRWLKTSWVSDIVPELGQWGISQDNYGRLFHDSNTDQLRASLVPPHYVDRNPHYHAAGANEQIAKDQSVYPAHATAVDRGYLSNIMRSDGTLRNFTAACAPLIYRGGIFPSEFSGNAFVCEPAANLIKRNILTESDGAITAKNAYENSEFLTSTYERFRPVSIYNGPDGALYILDMHHGLLQHKTYLTTYCKDQYLARELDKHLHTGRIYRIVPTDAKLYPAPNLSAASTSELVSHLSHANGWWRDTAQQLLVEHADYKAVPLLTQMATADANPLARLHALWTLEGFHIADPKVLTTALADADPKIRAAAIRLSEPLLSSATRAQSLPPLLKLASDPDPNVQLQFALTLSNIGAPESDAALISLLTQSANRPLIRDAVLSGLRGRELDFLQTLLASSDWSVERAGRPKVLQAFSKAILAEASAKRVAQLLQLIAKQPAAQNWRQGAMINGLADRPAQGKKNRNRPKLKGIMLDAEPSEFLALRRDGTNSVKEKLDDALDIIHWPGQPGYTPPPPPPPLTAQQQARFTRGQDVYTKTCAACHKPTGLGQEGMAPPLLNSEWILGPESRLARIVLHGLQGPVTVNGSTFSLDMPGLYALPDDDIAAVLTYVRRNWEHGSSPVEPQTIKQLRATTRPVPWTERELLKIK
jgi:mono/diheme cytochrome c family protein/glucose/arabinose dehydrogenase